MLPLVLPLVLTAYNNKHPYIKHVCELTKFQRSTGHQNVNFFQVGRIQFDLMFNGRLKIKENDILPKIEKFYKGNIKGIKIGSVGPG